METIRKQKWDWAGHMWRELTDNRWITRITFWTPQGYTRNQERPRTRWRDDLESFVKHWHRVAQNVVPVEVSGEGPRPTTDIQRLKLN